MHLEKNLKEMLLLPGSFGTWDTQRELLRHPYRPF